ncbi:MAG: class I SAM-dependent methyltransferase [Gemmatimonadota bacterium]
MSGSSSPARRLLPAPLRRWVTRLRRWPPVGRVRFGSLRRLEPISREWGFDRGRPVDRHYIERFLAAHAADIRGRVLEIGGSRYTRMFGGDRVVRSDVLHVAEGQPDVTIVADLTRTDGIAPGTFDCVIATQTLQFIYDVKAAIATLHRILKPGGVVLATIPGISKVSREDMDRWGHFWSFTTCSARRMFQEFFGPEGVSVEAHGNVLSAIAFLHGIADRELDHDELEFHDPDYEVLIGVRARKDGSK